MCHVRHLFIYSSVFRTDSLRLRLTDEDLRELELELMRRPDAGSVMKDTGGVRKLRFSPSASGRGKSGAVRICYTWMPEFSAICPLLIFAKNEQANLTAAERKVCRNLVQGISHYLETLNEKKKTHKKNKSIGPRLIASLTEIHDALAQGRPDRLTIREVRLPADPPPFDARAVKSLRTRLHVSQPIFAKLVGVSTVLARSWEQGQRRPSRLACRLLEEIERHPDHWLQKIVA
jgi:DNA-binding transcriptional regulator YiaG